MSVLVGFGYRCLCFCILLLVWLPRCMVHLGIVVSFIYYAGHTLFLIRDEDEVDKAAWKKMNKVEVKDLTEFVGKNSA